MSRYEINIEEMVPYEHTVIIETAEDEDIDELCDKIEKELNKLHCSISDIYWMPKPPHTWKVVELIEDEGSPGEFEITGYDEVTE